MAEFEDYTLVAMENALRGTLESTVPGNGIIASTAQALAGTNDTAIMTPVKVQQALSNIIFDFAPLNQAVPLSNDPTGWFLGKGSAVDTDFQWQQITITGTVATIGVTPANGFAGTSNGDAVNPRLTLTTSISGILQGNGTAISAASTTGTGDLVRATSPTLVTPALGTPSALVLTNATGKPASIDLTNATNVPVNQAIGNLGVSHLNGGTGASGTTFWAGDGTWKSPGAIAGTVQTVSVASANGFAGTSDGDPTDPTLTLTTTLGSGQVPVSNGTGFQSAPLTGTGNIVLANSPTLVTPALGTPSALVGTNITGTAAGLTAGNVTTNANLTGPITSVGNATAVASQTGTGSTFVMSVSPVLTTPNLGTPSAGVATNLTGTASGLTSGITNALKSATTTVDVAAATAPAAGQVLTATDSTHATWVSPAATTPRVTATTSTATLTPNSATTDIAAVTAQAAGLTVAAPTGSPIDGQQLTIRIRDNGTTRALTWNAAYVPFQSGQLPTTTIINKTHYLVFWWNATTAVWELVTGQPVAGLWG